MCTQAEICIDVGCSPDFVGGLLEKLENPGPLPPPGSLSANPPNNSSDPSGKSGSTPSEPNPKKKAKAAKQPKQAKQASCCVIRLRCFA